MRRTKGLSSKWMIGIGLVILVIVGLATILIHSSNKIEKPESYKGNSSKVEKPKAKEKKESQKDKSTSKEKQNTTKEAATQDKQVTDDQTSKQNSDSQTATSQTPAAENSGKPTQSSDAPAPQPIVKPSQASSSANSSNSASSNVATPVPAPQQTYHAPAAPGHTIWTNDDNSESSDASWTDPHTYTSHNIGNDGGIAFHL